MTKDEQRRRLKQLLKDGVISQETYDQAIAKVPEEKKLDVYNNQQGELCIILAYRNSKWIIRVPLMYEVWTYIRERYSMDNSKQGRKNEYLWKVLSQNREKILELDRQRKVDWLTSKEPAKPVVKSVKAPCNPALVALGNKQKVKSRVLTVSESRGWLNSG